MDKYYMNEALKEAYKAKEIDEVPVGAIIVKDNQIIARSYNQRETKNQSIYHAEILAIMKACNVLNTWKLNGCVMYVTLEPCAMCAGAIMQSRIDKVVYGVKDEKGGCIDSCINLYEQQGFNHYPIHISGVLEEECKNIIQDFFKEKRNIKKK